MRSRSAPPPPPPARGQRHDLRTVRRLLPYLWPRGETELRVRVVVALLFLAAAKTATVTVPLLYKQVVDILSAERSAAIVVPVGLLLAYGLTRFLQAAFVELQDLSFSKVAERAVRRIGLKTFRNLHQLSLRFHMDRQTGGLNRLIERGTRGIEVLLRLVLFRAGPSLLEMGFVAAILWSMFDWRYAAVTVATIGGYIVYTMLVTEWRLKFRRTMNMTDADANTKAIDSLINYETVKYFGNERHESARYDTALQAYEHASLKSKTSLALLNLGQGAIIGVGLVVLMVMAGQGVAAGALTVGDFVLVNTYLIQLALPLNFLGVVYREIKQSLTDMETMFDLMDSTPEVLDAPDARPLAITDGRVEFADVRFGYGPDREVLRGITFSVAGGRMVALVGSSGAGKSTISRLLFRFYDVTGGAVRIDGQDIRAVTQDSLRAAIGVVPQDTVLFNDSIYYNIAYGRPDASREEVETAARMAAIHDFVQSLPQGYDTVVGERGLKLSGGEKQRVAIARTILKNPAILIFDEATSALDTHTEREIQASLRRVAADRTTLVIAHRLSTVVDADEILVLAGGRVVERGRHGELLAHGGLYADMWHKQRETAALEEALRAARDGDSLDAANAPADG
ncbi:ABCB family ABC transporter ATP-binding protein/permease [Novispirillum sp. DQ9]|uniref:ABCB family ABC transporter ATP-binding protein/permease n=1 Tax=Novispirillum sp. DQ9 TaxID=3398612 RepID=UPI003C7E85DE